MKGSEDDFSKLNLMHYENMPMQYTDIFQVVKNENFQKKISRIFSYFCSKYRFWVHVRTA